MKKQHPARLGGMVALLLCALALGTATAHAETGVSPTTGLPTDQPYRPILAQINNSTDARPPWGLEEADIVYETLIWGPHHTRYLAVFNDSYPERVGSLRGARVYAMELREEWDCPFVFWGGQASEGTSIYAFLTLHDVPALLLVDGTKPTVYAPYTSRARERVSPHNAVINLQALVAESWPKDDSGAPFAPSLPLLAFSDTPSRGNEAATSIVVDYDALLRAENGGETPEGSDRYRAAYTYDPETRLYKRWYNGAPQTGYDGQTPVLAANVIVQYCLQGYYAGAPSRPITQTIGTGPIDAFIDGTHIRGTWARETFSDKTRFLDAEGNPLVLLPGKTFIQMVPPDVLIQFTAEEGGLSL